MACESKKVNRNIADSVAKEQHDKEDERVKRKKLSKSKAKAGRIKADKRSKS